MTGPLAAAIAQQEADFQAKVSTTTAMMMMMMMMILCYP
jgi:hypothetical protein